MLDMVGLVIGWRLFFIKKILPIFISLSSWSRYVVHATRVVYCVALRQVTLSRRIFALAHHRCASVASRHCAALLHRIAVTPLLCSCHIASSHLRVAAPCRHIVAPSCRAALSCRRRAASLRHCRGVVIAPSHCRAAVIAASLFFVAPSLRRCYSIVALRCCTVIAVLAPSSHCHAIVVVPRHHVIAPRHRAASSPPSSLRHRYYTVDAALLHRLVVAPLSSRRVVRSSRRIIALSPIAPLFLVGCCVWLSCRRRLRRRVASPRSIHRCCAVIALLILIGCCVVVVLLSLFLLTLGD
jgi:hypothetical protein